MRRKYPKPAELSVSQILAWADTFHKRFGKWPHARAGRIAGSPGENWRKVDNALRIGLRGLPGGTTLAGLLFEQRGRRHLFKLPRLTEEQILFWADRHRKRTGRWPKQKSGPVLDRPEETWASISDDLRSGRRGLAGGSSLADLLFRRRGVRHHLISPRLTLEQILAWADAYDFTPSHLGTDSCLGGRISPTNRQMAQRQFGCDSKFLRRNMEES